MLKNESTEMYLETILRLSERSKAIREVDLADAMRISKVSVCKAVKRLVETQLVTYKDHRIALTKEGRAVAVMCMSAILCSRDFWLRSAFRPQSPSKMPAV